MKKYLLLFVASALAAAGSLQAAGTIKTYTNRAAFAAEDVVDWGGLTNLAGGDKCVSLSGSFTGLKSGLLSTTISGSVVKNGFTRCNEGISYFGNFTGGDRLLATDVKGVGPMTFNFTSGPVYGAGLQIEGFTAGPFTATITAFDAAGNILGQLSVTGTTTSILPADNTAPFVGIRSSAKEIAKIQVETPGSVSFAVNKLDVALSASPVLNSSFFINQLYRDLLNRATSSAELAAASNTLTAGGTLQDVGLAVFETPEFYNNANYLAKCYLALQGRDPDITTFNQIFKVMQGGTQQIVALNGFLGTPEYTAAYPATLSNTQFVTKLYQNLLGRAPEASGLSYWTFILNLGISRSFVLHGFITSPEYDARVAHRVNSNLLYMAFLRRSGDPGGLNFWTVTQDFGVPLSGVIGGFVGSPEYLARF